MLFNLAFDLAKFLKELEAINNIDGPSPGQHNWWRGDHLSVYDSGAREQIAKLNDVIDSNKSIKLWEHACKTKWNKPAVWIHGDFAVGNMLVKNQKLSAIIDFGGMALGDPACDLIIAWTYLKKEARKIFMTEMNMDENTWLRARGWALWKASYELCEMEDMGTALAIEQKKIIEEVINY